MISLGLTRRAYMFANYLHRKEITMTESKAIEILVAMLRKGTAKDTLSAKAWDLSIEIDGWCDPNTLVLKAEMAVS